MKKFKMVFSVLVAALTVQSAFAAVDPERRNLEIANALVACQAQVTEAAQPGIDVAEIVVNEMNDLDQYEFLFARLSHSPLMRSRGTAVLHVTRTFQPTMCPPGAMDCGGGRFVYQCSLNKAGAGSKTMGCTRDINRWGQASNCSCEEASQKYDARLGACFAQ